MPSIGRIQRAESVRHDVLGNRPLWYVRGVGPDLVIVHRRYRVAVLGIALAVAKNGILLARIVGRDERTIVMLRLDGGQKISIPHRFACRAEDSLKPPRADRGGYLVRNRVAIADLYGADGAKIPCAGVVRTLGVCDPIRKLGDH